MNSYAIARLAGTIPHPDHRDADIQREVIAKLSLVAAVTEMQVRQWIESRVAGLAFVAAQPVIRENVVSLADGTDAGTARETLRTQLRAVLEHDPALRCLAVLDSEGRVLVSTDPQSEGSPAEQTSALEPEQDSGLHFITLDPAADVGLVITQRITGLDGRGGGGPSLLHEAAEVYLVDATGMALPLGREVSSQGIEAALAGEDGEGLYENYTAVPVIGVYRWIPELGLALVAEQAQEQAFARTDNVTATVIGATLIVALATAIVAAVVTRQITRPVVRLTESALRIAEGDLEQQVPVKSRDEIGILAYVFNRMAAELKALYDDLEGKVAQRTALLQRANYQIQRRAIQLAATMEVVRLIHDRFVYSYVGIYPINCCGRWCG